MVYEFVNIGIRVVDGVHPLLRARAKITSHFGISASAHLWSISHSQNPRNSLLFLWFHSLESAKPEPKLSANSVKLFLREPQERLFINNRSFVCHREDRMSSNKILWNYFFNPIFLKFETLILGKFKLRTQCQGRTIYWKNNSSGLNMIRRDQLFKERHTKT